MAVALVLVMVCGRRGAVTVYLREVVSGRTFGGGCDSSSAVMAWHAVREVLIVWSGWNMQEKLAAAKAMQRAITVASESTTSMAAIAEHFESLQVCLSLTSLTPSHRPPGPDPRPPAHHYMNELPVKITVSCEEAVLKRTP